MGRAMDEMLAFFVEEERQWRVLYEWGYAAAQGSALVLAANMAGSYVFDYTVPGWVLLMHLVTTLVAYVFWRRTARFLLAAVSATLTVSLLRDGLPCCGDPNCGCRAIARELGELP